MEEKQFYKAVRVLLDGSRVSSFIDPELWCTSTGFGEKMLTYHPNRIISAPKGSYGIFVYDRKSLMPIANQGGFNFTSGIILGNVFQSTSFSKVVEIYKVIPISPVIFQHLDIGNYWISRVIRLGKLVGKLALTTHWVWITAPVDLIGEDTHDTA